MKLMLFIAVFISSAAFAGAGHHQPKLSPDFEKMKALLGTWEGKTKMHGQEQMMTVKYALTSGGTAIAETMDPGGPHEMLTVYANRGSSVAVTHFCAAGNQPEMKLKKADGSTFAFEMDGDMKGVSSPKEEHMHAVTLAVNGNTLKQEWTNWKDGKKGESVVFNFTKKN